MCGIIGFSGTFCSLAFYAGLDAIAHRGPDDCGTYLNDEASVGLGHRRLSILDISPLGHQPMLSDDKKIVLIFNGEIYNYKELRLELKAKGIVFHGHSDTEVLLNLYLLEGEEMLRRLNGIFAFAIWDGYKKSLLIARDALGVKPLYYSQSQRGFAFASEIKALIHLASKTKELDLTSIHRYLSFLWCPGDGVPIKDIRKLLPGEAMWIVGGEIEQRWIWYKLPVFRKVSVKISKNSLIKDTEHYLRQAVQRQMVSDVPVGAFLSGGLDSSSIVAFAREYSPKIHCFTIESVGGLESGMVDDLPYAQKVAQHLNVPLDIVSIDSESMANSLQYMVENLDEPIADPAAFNVLYISQLARDKGIKVLLSGVGGDDLFTGYKRHRALNLERYWRWLPVEVLKNLENITSKFDQRNTFYRRVTKLFGGASLNGDERLINYFRWAREEDLLKLYTIEARMALGDELSSKPMVDYLAPLPVDISPMSRMLSLEQRFFLADHNLNYTDKMSMAFGVEVRVPFLDLDLIEFASQIPEKFKQCGAEGKWILKKAMEPYLPHEIIYRRKSGFGAPLRRWMRHDLKGLLDDLLSTDSLRHRGIFDPTAVHKMIADNALGKVDASYTLLSLLCIEIWCRRFIDRPL